MANNDTETNFVFIAQLVVLALAGVAIISTVMFFYFEDQSEFWFRLESVSFRIISVAGFAYLGIRACERFVPMLTRSLREQLTPTGTARVRAATTLETNHDLLDCRRF
jgi:hypothetical protein